MLDHLHLHFVLALQLDHLHQRASGIHVAAFQLAAVHGRALRRCERLAWIGVAEEAIEAALQALVAAAGFAHTTDPRGIAATLHAERFDLVLGSVGFDAKGDVTAQGYVLYVWRDGKFTPAGKP